ncbi:LysR family transcriptional regulator [Hydrogenophaga sp. Root209]|uniref:LysR family transcriptional regulator n=1 Tax=unclassified Hydrogenophaga TaxID=2610897 RepID=UPI0006F3E3AE|nr:LysR family transcriptional regulator [Hydrogenophaga sp. Root209]KRB96866.1 LysR family transcriptional regulator [Hydrogenophaga sp. Root209]
MATSPTQQLLNRMRMRQVALLLAIGKSGTLRAAAAELGMTQPAATKMLRELENALGHALFERAGRGLKLTESGRCTLGYFEGLQGSLDALTRELDGIEQGGSGKLFIGSIMAASPELLSESLLRLRETYPQLAIEIMVDTSDRLTDALRRGDLDLVIGRVPEGALDDMEFKPVADEALSVVAGPTHPLAHKPRVAFDELLDHPWILQPRGSPMREVLEQEFRRNKARLPRGLVETSSILTTMNLLVRSDMIAVIPAEVAARYESHGMLACIRYAVRQQLGVFGCLMARGRPPSPPLAHLLSLLLPSQPGSVR